MDKTYSANHIPGMIEPVEQQILFELARDYNFIQNEQVVEVGSFLGRSTTCLCEGVKLNKSTGSRVVHAYDFFECSLSGSFYPQLLFHLGEFKCHLLDVQEATGTVNFLPAFLHFVQDHIKNERLVVHKGRLVDARWDGAPVGILHIDAPKFYREWLKCANLFFPYLREGSVVVAQDFFYHWSAELISAIALLVKKEYFQPIVSAASSLVLRCQKVIFADDLFDIHTEFINSDISVLIDNISSSLHTVRIDRPNLFLPRLFLAKFQHLYSQGQANDAVNLLIAYLNNDRAGLNTSVINDFFDLLRHNFTILNDYEIDQDIS